MRSAQSQGEQRGEFGGNRSVRRVAANFDRRLIFALAQVAPLDGATRDQVRMLAARAGLTLNNELFELMCQTAPYALAFCERVRREQAWSAEQAAVFRLPVDPWSATTIHADARSSGLHRLMKS